MVVQMVALMVVASATLVTFKTVLMLIAVQNHGLVMVSKIVKIKLMVVT